MQFELSPNELASLVESRDIDKLRELGGLSGIAKALNTDLTKGITLSLSDTVAVDIEPEHSVLRSLRSHLSFSLTRPETISNRITVFGTNTLPQPKERSVLQLMSKHFLDKTLLVLAAAAVIKIGIGIYKSLGAANAVALIDGFAIVAAVLIVVCVGSYNDFRKQRQFRALNSYSQSLAMSKAIRDGSQQQVQNAEIVVGDIVKIETGDVLPADGILISGFGLQTDESSLTGESHAIKKTPEEDPFLLSGTKVVDGMGTMLVIGVGVNSLNGRTLLTLQVEPEATPLQQKISSLANRIAKFAFVGAFGMVVLLIIAYLTVIPISSRAKVDLADHIVNIFISAITLVVVSIPEGLPLAVTIALSYATVQMLKDNNLVRHLAACETMGNATTICSDKTGTLTQNKMTVTTGIVFDSKFQEKDINLHEKGFFECIKSRFSANFELLMDCINVNGTAVKSILDDGSVNYVGSMTEIALIEFTEKFGYSYNVSRKNATIVRMVPFSSARKKMVTVIERNGDQILYCKGASEIVLARCTKYIDGTGIISELSPDKLSSYHTLIGTFASQALRTIAVAYKQFNEKEDPEDPQNLILLAIVGIEDPVRDEVPDAVRKCQDAGIVVRMVTGDNKLTATSIAKKCGILKDGGVVMEGPQFRALPDKERLEIVPKLQVLARSSPQDKQTLVNTLKSLGETVAVTGDGTNDAPALKAADVGFSMGIAGTEVAKEASDIVLMDDNFASLVKAVVWGRSVYDSVRKFLQFQLTVNVTAVVITVLTSFISIFSSENNVPYSVFHPIQLLWVNLIMNTFAALALATDHPSERLLKRRPERKSDPLISRPMWSQIIGHSIFQIAICLILYLAGDKLFESIASTSKSKNLVVSKYTETLIFNSFIFCQIFNEINSRSISLEKNVFKGISKNRYFATIWCGTIVAQAIIVQFGSSIFYLVPGGLDATGWLVCVLIGSCSPIVGLIIRLAYARVVKEKSITKESFSSVLTLT